MKELFIKYFRDASSYQSIDPTCFDLTEYTETWLINHKEQLRIGVVVNCVYVVTYNDDYGRPIFDNCFNKLNIAKEYINDHDYLRMDNTTVIKEVEF